MKSTGMVALALLVAALAGGLIALQLFPKERTETVIEIREDTTLIAALRAELREQRGETTELRTRVTQEERASAAWKKRAALLASIVQSMAPVGPRPDDTTGIPEPGGDSIQTAEASITRTVTWPGDSAAAAAIDTVFARYDIARDLWTALGVGYQERRIRDRVSYSTTHTEEGGGSFPFLAVGMTTVIVLLLAVVIGRAVGQ